MKTTLQHFWKRLCALGDIPSGAVRSKNRSYRTGFQRSIGAIVFLFIFLAIASRKLSGVKASSNNNGIYILLIMGAIVAGLGAFFAPRITAFLYSHSVSGRRHQASKALHASSHQSRRRSRSLGSSGSNATSHSRSSDHDTSSEQPRS